MIQLRPIAVALIATSMPITAAAEAEKLAVIPTQFDESSRGQVPDLFDDYLLTAVQNVGGNYEVIGQEDISALLGFEEQKDLVDCSDTSCMADIGGALGVDKLIVVKIARLGEDWVATAKIINIKETRVDSRVNEIVGGNVKSLLQAVPRLVARLFGRPPPPGAPVPSYSPPPTSTSTPPPTYSPPPPAASVTPTTPPQSTGPDPKKGKALRIVGTIMLISGGAIAVIGGLMLTFANSGLDGGGGGFCPDDGEPGCASYDYINGWCDTSCDTGTVFANTLDTAVDVMLGVYGALALVAGFVVEGIGAKLRVMGAAKAALGTNKATSTPALYWLGWVLAGLTIVYPIVAVTDLFEPIINVAIGWGLGASAGLLFLITGFGKGSPHLSSGLPIPKPVVTFARTGRHRLDPTIGFAFVW